MALNVRVFSAGHTEQLAVFAERDGPLRKTHFPATAVLVEHPREGLVLFDTAYSPFFFEATSRLPEKIYALVTPVTIAPEDTVAAQMSAAGYDVNDVRTVILSHFHADHVGGARLFPRARFVAKRSAWEAVRHRSRLSATFAGFLRGLLPSDFEDRLDAFNDDRATALDLGPFREGFDLFGDGSISLIDLPGHATGQVGAFVHSRTGPTLFAADAVWSERAYTEGVLPHPLAHVVLRNFDHDAYVASVDKLAALHRARPDVRIVPCHCGKAHAAWEKAHA
jgi:glyoxylase-like metal-dependent hydrolase (beta-lactamase superfamily II)